MQKKQTTKGPSPDQILWFDFGRAYQLGVMVGTCGVDRLTYESFLFHGRMILIRYLNPRREDILQELFKSFNEGWDKGKEWRSQGLKVSPEVGTS